MSIGRRNLQGGEQIFRLLVETVEDYALCALDLEGRVVYWNVGAELTPGYSQDEILGRSLDLIFTPEDRAAGAPEQERRTALANGRSEDERFHLRKDGSRFWSVGVLAPVRDEAGGVIGFGKILRDRTDQRVFEDALHERAAMLAQADADKNIFLATLAHELRTPLSVLMNSSGVLRRGANFDRVRLADMIERQVRHAQRLIEDLMDIVRASRDKLQIERTRLDLRDVAAQAAEMLGAAMAARQHDFILEQPDAPVIVCADPNRLVQVLVNLLNNAMKFTDLGGRIALTTTMEGPEAVVRVEDNGVWIPPERLATIFDLFAQAHPGLAGSQLGIGIGLALTRDLVVLHGGSIQARSAGIGKGNQFTVRLPLFEGGQTIRG